MKLGKLGVALMLAVGLTAADAHAQAGETSGSISSVVVDIPGERGEPQSEASSGPVVTGGPLSQGLFFGPSLARNLEFEAFQLGMQMGIALNPTFLNSLLLGSIDVTRMGISNGSTIWQIAPMVTLLLSGPATAWNWTAALGPLASRRSSELVSGTEYGFALQLGVLYGMSQWMGAGAHVGLRRAGGFNQFTIGSSLLMNPSQR